jgi:hypothetical protein
MWLSSFLRTIRLRKDSFEKLFNAQLDPFKTGLESLFFFAIRVLNVVSIVAPQSIGIPEVIQRQ